MPATTTRGTDAERTEEAAPVALEDVLEEVLDAAALLVLDGKTVGLVTTGTVDGAAAVVLFPGETVAETEGSDSGVVEISGGMKENVAVPVPGITVGNVSMLSSLCTKSSEKHWNSMVNSRGNYEVGSGDSSPCGRAKAAAATTRSVKN